MNPGRPTLPPAAAALHATHEAQRVAEARDEARRQAVLYRGTRFAHPRIQPPKPGQGSAGARRRRAKLPQARKRKGASHEAEHDYVPVHVPDHAVVGSRESGGQGSSGGGDHSHHGRGATGMNETNETNGINDKSPAKLPDIRSVATVPVRPRAASALPRPTIGMSDPEQAEAVRAALCNALLALRDDPGASRVVGVTELQLDRLDAAQAYPPLREAEAMGTLRQRLIDASNTAPGKKDPFNLLLPLVLLMSERPLSATRQQASRSTLAAQRNAALARAVRSR